MPKNNKRPSSKSTSRKNRTDSTKPKPRQNLQAIKSSSMDSNADNSSTIGDVTLEQISDSSEKVEPTPINPSPARLAAISINDGFFKKEIIRIGIIGGFTTLMLAIVSFAIKST